jgi:hypothetical protein
MPKPRTYVNTGAVALVLLDPAVVVPPGGTVELPYAPTHRDLAPAPAATTPTSGQE